MHSNRIPAIAAWCGLDGRVTRVLHDGFGLKDSLAVGEQVERIADTGSRSKMLELIRKIKVSGAAFDWELGTAVSELALFLSGCRTPSGIFILGFLESRSVEELECELVRMTQKEAAGHTQEAFGSPRHFEDASERRLNGQVARLNDHLLRAQRELLKKDLEIERQKVETFRHLGMTVHGLRNPASGILSALEYLIENSSIGLDETHRALLQNAAKSSSFMLKIIDQVLDISTIECGKLKVELGPTDLVSLAKQALLLNAQQAEQKQVRLETSWEKPSIIVEADAIKITQVIDNLVSNAIKFSKPGGKVLIRAVRQGNIATVVVQDEGVGISADRVNGIFEPFRNTAGDKLSMKGGTGLGLAISRRIVEGHAGTIGVNTELGKGSSFTVSLPIGLNAKTRLALRPGRGSTKVSEPDAGLTWQAS